MHECDVLYIFFFLNRESVFYGLKCASPPGLICIEIKVEGKRNWSLAFVSLVLREMKNFAEFSINQF